jgi:hypothetical protein
MCKGIAVIVYEKDGELKGLCSGISSHDELCKQVEEIRYGDIEPYRFELLYPYNLTFDRAHTFIGAEGICSEQPKKEIWNVAFDISRAFVMKHTRKQLDGQISEGQISEGQISVRQISDGQISVRQISQGQIS